MAGNAVNARVGAVREIGHGVASYGKSLAAALSSARADLNRAGAQFNLAVVDAQRQLTAAEQRTATLAAELSRCQEGCEGLHQQLIHARAAQRAAQFRLDAARRAEARFERAAAELLSSIRRTEASAGELVPQGRAFIRDYAEMLTAYLATEVSG